MIRRLLAGVVLLACGCGDGADKPSAGGDKSPTVSKPAAADRGAMDSKVSRARQAAARGELAQAIDLLSQVIGANAEHAEAYLVRAEVYVVARQDANALADFSTVIRIEPRVARYRIARGRFLLARGKAVAAIEDFGEAVRLAPDSPAGYNGRGVARVARREYDEAIKDFTTAIGVDASFVDAWNNRGCAQFRLGNNEQAAADFAEAIRRNPEFVAAFQSRALLHLKTKNFDQVVADASAALVLDPDNLRLLGLRRTAYRELGRAREARLDGERLTWLINLRRLSQAVGQRPRDPKTYIARAGHLAAGGRSALALADYERAIQVAPAQSAEALLERAAFWLADEQLDKAIADCNTILKTVERHRAYSIRGEAQFGRGDLDLAIADFEKARRFDTMVAEAHWRRAQRRETAGETAGAAVDRKRAIQLDPERYPPTSPRGE